MTEKIGSKNAHIIWQQTGDEENPVAERPLLIETYNDVISIGQEGKSINLNYGSIDELCKLLKKLKTE